MKMPKRSARKERLRAALALKGLSMAEFGRKLGVTGMHVAAVAAGDRPSERISRAVDAFIEKHLPTADRGAA